MKKWKLGVVGLGEGRSIISAALASAHWELINICDLDETLCKERCNEFGLIRYTLDYEELLRDDDIEVIGIYTPDPLHPKHIEMALTAGKHVICTKPLLISLDEVGHLLAVQESANRTVFVGQSSRYFEPAKQQRKDYELGKHGVLSHVETHYITDARWFLGKPWSRKSGFSWMYNFLIHALDLAVWYLPNIESVYGISYISDNTKEYDVNVPDSLHFLLRNEDGRTASIQGVYTLPVLEYSVEQAISCTLRGTKGVSRAGYPKLVYHTNFEQKYEEHSYEELHPYYFRFGGETHHAGEYQNYIEEFAQCMDQGIVPKPDLKEGFYTLAIMEAMQKTIETNQVVYIKDILQERGLKIDSI